MGSLCWKEHCISSMDSDCWRSRTCFFSRDRKTILSSVACHSITRYDILVRETNSLDQLKTNPGFDLSMSLYSWSGKFLAFHLCRNKMRLCVVNTHHSTIGLNKNSLRLIELRLHRWLFFFTLQGTTAITITTWKEKAWGWRFEPVRVNQGYLENSFLSCV